MSTIIQRAFSGGEISPALRERVDQSKYQSGCSILRNFQVLRYGGAQNRAGSSYIGEVKDSTLPVRLIPFVFNNDQTYVLEFGQQYMRVVKNGSYLRDGSYNIASATNANPAVFSYGTGDSANLQVGDTIQIQGVYGFVNRTFVVNTVPSVSTFTLKNVDGTLFDSTALGASTTGTFYRIYQITTPYQAADIPLIQYVQSADVMTLVHQLYAPKKLSRGVGDVFTLSDYTFSPAISAPIIKSATAGGSGGVVNKYRATAIDKTTGEESLLSTFTPKRIQAITKANPAQVTTLSAHGFLTGDSITFDTMSTGMIELSGVTTTITVTGANTFTLDGIDSTGYTSFVYNQNAYYVTRYYYRIDSAQPSTTAPNTLVIGASITNGKSVVVYKEYNGTYGFLGSADVDSNGVATFKDVGLTPDVSDQAPVDRNPFLGNTNYPACVNYIQQRLVFANTSANPETVYMSRTGKFTNFTSSTPIADDNAVTFRMTGSRVNAVRYLIDIGQFLVLTSGGEWAVMGDNNVITPTGISLKQYSYNGSAPGLQPIIIDNTAVYAQARGTILRDLAFNYQVDGYTGNDLTVFSSHLFDKFTIKDWTYQQVPHSTLWAVRSDGTLLGLTYVKEQQILAWHHHDTDGVYENVCAVPEGQEDALYAVVRRTVNGRTRRYVERFGSRKIYDLRDNLFTDSTLSYDGRNTDTTRLVTLLSFSGSWMYEDDLTLISGVNLFATTDVGAQYQITDQSGNVLRLTVTAFTNSQTVTVRPDRTVPLNFQGVSFSSWAKAVSSLKGLYHLEGKTVSIVGDANVVASANNPNYDPIVVTNGQVTFDKPYAVVKVGLAYTSDLQTLQIDSTQSETLINKQKLINQVSVSFEETRGGWLGTDVPVGSDATLNLNEFKPRSNEPYDSPISLYTGHHTINIQGSYNNNGRVLLRQLEPLPMSVLAIAPSGLLPFKQG